MSARYEGEAHMIYELTQSLHVDAGNELRCACADDVYRAWLLMLFQR